MMRRQNERYEQQSSLTPTPCLNWTHRLPIMTIMAEWNGIKQNATYRTQRPPLPLLLFHAIIITIILIILTISFYPSLHLVAVCSFCVRNHQSRDKTKMRSLKDRYENFLQEEQRRLARNDKLLQTMEDIDYRASTLAAKTERLKLLKVSIIKKSHLVGFLSLCCNPSHMYPSFLP